jgi:hypothetical protein
MSKMGAKKNRTWVVSLIRKHLQFLGLVEAPNREAAESFARLAAIKRLLTPSNDEVASTFSSTFRHSA